MAAQAPSEGSATSGVAAQAPLAPPDVVRTLDGGVYRGTLVEYVPFQRATIRLLDGQVRTLSGANILYAGPASLDPASTTAPVAATSPGAPAPAPTSSFVAPGGAIGTSAVAPATSHVVVRFESQSSGLVLHLDTSPDAPSVQPAGAPPAPRHVPHFEPVCAAPCSAPMPPGPHRFGIAAPGRPPAPVDGVVVVGADDVYRLEYRSRARVRAIGWVTLVVGIAVGGSLLVTGIVRSDCSSDVYGAPCPNDRAMIAGGAATAGVGIVAGAVMASLHDRARVVPLRVTF
ncbi:MAG: hypothetical protein U0230_04405 [Polyangiales bacterium]